MFSWIFCDIFKNCFFNKTLLGLLPLSLSRIIKAESKQELQQIQEKILRVIPISVVKHLHRIKYSPNQFSLKLYVKWECQNSFVTLIVTLYPTLHKNKVLYRGFLQHMWPNPQFHSHFFEAVADTRMFHDKISLFWWNKYVTSGKWLKRSFKGLWTW